jgi:hypothetical protein
MRLKATAANERFGASGGVSPQEKEYEIARKYPARTVVFPRLRQAAGTLAAI